MNVAYLLTGGNIGNRAAMMESAKVAIGEVCGSILAASYVYETEAWGTTDQAPYLNQALKISTHFSAPELLEKVLTIEQELGRIRQIKYGPRVIDIDILLFNNEVIQLPGLSVPHPQLPYRRFALQCLAAIGGGEVHPVLGKTISTLLEECADTLAVRKIEAPMQYE